MKTLDELTPLQQEYLLTRELIERGKRRKLWTYYPETGPLSRHEYKKHMEFFRAGSEHRERLMLAANRVGKTEGVGGYETTLHLTGEYPDWWEGKRFDRAIVAWASGEDAKSVRDSLQLKMLGPHGHFGTGLIPAETIGKWTPKSGVPEAVDTIYVKHANGVYSRLVFKSYDQGREAYQATEVDVVWNDEEPPLDVYTESLIRTMTTDGIVMNTFTPLQGMSEVVMLFLPGGKLPNYD